MTTDSQRRDSKRSHNKRKEDAEEVGKQKNMSDEDFDKEMAKLKAQLINIKQLLEKEIKEDLNQGWNVRKRFKWPVMRLFSKK